MNFQKGVNHQQKKTLINNEIIFMCYFSTITSTNINLETFTITLIVLNTNKLTN